VQRREQRQGANGAPRSATLRERIVGGMYQHGASRMALTDIKSGEACVVKL